jgi:SM-20-related protein
VIDLLKIDRALDPVTCERIRREMRAAEGDAATVLGTTSQGGVRSVARRATRLAVGEPARGAVASVLERLQPRIEAHFRYSLDTVEEPQFLRYGEGDYFVAHQDGNTPLVHDESRFRKVSAVIFLGAQSDRPTRETYCGGALVLHAPYGQAEPRIDPRACVGHAGGVPLGDHPRGAADHSRRALVGRLVVSRLTASHSIRR